MSGSTVQTSVAVKIIFCSLNDLLSGDLVSVLIKEIGSSVNGLPACVTVLSGCFTGF